MNTLLLVVLGWSVASIVASLFLGRYIVAGTGERTQALYKHGSLSGGCRDGEATSQKSDAKTKAA